MTFSEWALANPAAYAYRAPILVENNGWALFITSRADATTPSRCWNMARGSSDWFAQVLTVDNTGATSREAVEIQRREYHGIYGDEAGDAPIEQEYFCPSRLRFSASIGASSSERQSRAAGSSMSR
ncbi:MULTISPECIES: hypothetical protein [Bradyrhizobium]|uniref:Uncharacterized protein n=1 Tax=Bradyrhizobium elkanii TaxID=29448 RepID=A0A8I1Y9E6_BRAEL|nr:MULTISPECIES: hypothetical protein [Bradyrhizobium]MBP1294419.1 hypothetical protein [Bradyrhizobium elkanii]MCP1925193.1 hypothetical protein [Bradyrhizobium elkanii]MCS3477318.1 hypothetical protein [Bradyrhizobium elkanii]MCS3584053.1 hypothetical protein [Bradyrhizobium elkanii]MCS3717624.1 hypothetical protein [Bradyrhizobium elkanii]